MSQKTHVRVFFDSMFLVRFVAKQYYGTSYRKSVWRDK